MNEDYTYNLGSLFYKVSLDHATNTAIRFVDNSTVSYSDLNSLSNKIGRYLIDKGVVKNDVVVILNNKSTYSYAIMIACLKIGAIYTNLDPNSPSERFYKMVDQCQPKALLYFKDQKLVDSNSDLNFLTVNYESESFKQTLNNHPDSVIENTKEVNGSDPAYIMFTSGSTGFPKGVVITHTNILNFIKWAKTTYSISENDAFTNINPMHFDNSVFDFYASLFNASCLIPVQTKLSRNPKRMIEALNSVSPTIWFSVPSMLVYVLNMRALTKEDLPTLRTVTFGGEGFPKNQLRKLWSYWGDRVEFINVYGPTECTCICSSYKVTDEDLSNDELLPLGPMAPNFYERILNENNQEVKDGEIGELCIGGPNVGVGYFNDEERTKDVFVTDPLLKKYDRTIYKSGDLVKKDLNKRGLIFCGRKDNQIKKMGYRIELEEIENALNSIMHINESAVIYVDNSKYRSKIIAFIKSDLEEKEVKDILKKKLPLYMIPDQYVYKDYLPKNQNGKINRLALKKDFEI